MGIEALRLGNWESCQRRKDTISSSQWLKNKSLGLLAKEKVMVESQPKQGTELGIWARIASLDLFCNFMSGLSSQTTIYFTDFKTTHPVSPTES